MIDEEQLPALCYLLGQVTWNTITTNLIRLVIPLLSPLVYDGHAAQDHDSDHHPYQ